jgi:Prolyl oligopeptidase family
MEKNGLPVTYVLYPDEGHGFARPENRIDFFARSEAFLSSCLGGRAEPLPKDGKIAGSTAQVKIVAAKK